MDHNGSTILVVDDDAATAELQRRKLARAGYQTEVATNTTDAKQRIERNGISLILLDFRLADETGLDFFGRLKNDGMLTPTILVTGFSNEALVVQALRAGVSDFVQKSPDYLDYLPHAVRQVLDRARTERLLIESEARKAAMLESALDAIITIDENERIIEFNPAAERTFGYRRDDAMGRNLAELILPPPEPGSKRRPFGDLLHTDEGALTGRRMEMAARRAGGGEIFVELSISAFHHGDERLFTAFFRDITDRKRMETGLKLQQRALEEITEGILFTDPTQPDNPIVYVNPAFERLTGYRAGEVIGKNCRLLQGPKTDPVAVGKLRRAVEQRRPAAVELLNYRADGTPFWNAVSIAPLHDDQGRVTNFVGVQVDMTQRRALEERVRQTQKMEAIGRLAGGVAHDFNNLLTIILGNAEFALDDARTGSTELPERIQEIADAAERAAALTKQLLAFSRRQAFEPKTVDVNRLVGDIEKMVRRLVGTDVVVEVKLDSAAGNVLADPTQIEQIVFNLAANARDAMPAGGTLTIETRSVELDAAYAEHHPDARPGRYLRLSVNDTGVGIPPDVRPHIFEPFFTTKEVGQGTGMGLATVFGIVQQSRGHISVYSEPALGTTFHCYFPSIAQSDEVDEPTSSAGVPHGTESILLVEDDEPVRRLAMQILRTAGYAVSETASGNEALKLAADKTRRIDLVVTDVVMPGMTGREMAERLAMIRPGIKVLFVSGYANDAAVNRGVLPPGTAFLQKPFTLATLTQKVREVLDG
jgi:two-component system cell cycle sensor histidine kinase/response regulator CckA